MKILNTEINGVKDIFPNIYYDDRGKFFESFNAEIDFNIIQCNESQSYKNVLRGLHFQKYPHTQSKLIKVTYGKIFDVAVDIRKNSKTFGKYISRILTNEYNNMLLIPKGFAHGFLVLSDFAIVNYFCDKKYNKNSESGIIWNDKDINIKWPITEEPIISNKDSKLQTLQQYIINN